MDTSKPKRGRPKGRSSLTRKRHTVTGKSFLGASLVSAELLKRGRSRAFIRDHLSSAYGYRSRQSDKAIDWARRHLIPDWRPKAATEFWTTGQSTPDFLREAYMEFLGNDEGEQALEDEVADLFRIGSEWVRMPK